MSRGVRMRERCAALALVLLTAAACSRSEASEAAASTSAPAANARSAPASRSSAPPIEEPAVSGGERGEPSHAGPRPARELTFRYDDTLVGSMQVVVSVPAQERGDERFPVLITMHGRGEALKGPARGARGWIDDYWLPRAIERLRKPPLEPADLLGMVDPERLRGENASLARTPYRGLIVVCPYTPESLGRRASFSKLEPMASFLVDVLIPRVFRETPALGTPASTGVDGVSLGGRAALLVGLLRPEAFGAVGALQPAFDSSEAKDVAALAARARAREPELAIRLLSSEGDFFLGPTRAISRELRARQLDHELVVLPGPHDYAFNRGPGAFEMLLFHDRALRGEQRP